MEEQLTQLIKEAKSNSFQGVDESATKQAIILRAFHALGWNIYDINEVKPEYSLSGKSVDYSLRVDGQDKVFVEVKRVGEDLENHQKQLLDYSFEQGIELASLTNGLSWWLYLPLQRGSWEQRKFYAIDLIQQDEEEVAQSFTNFLSKTNVQTRKAIKLAKALHKNREKENIIQENLPKAWNKLLLEPDERFIALIGELVERLSGYPPTDEQVANFVNVHKSTLIISEEEAKRVGGVKDKKDKGAQVSRYIRQGYTGKQITAFHFLGRKYEVKYWIEMLGKITEILLRRHKKDFSKVLELRGYERPYFTRNKNELRVPWRIQDTGIYVETNLGSNLIVKICNNMIALFGYKEEIKIDTK